jgi:hypothetical protein
MTLFQHNKTPQSMTKFSWTKVGFVLGIAFFVGGSSVNAIPLSTIATFAEQTKNTNPNFAPFLRLISQGTTEPPEVIIDDPNSSPSVPDSTTTSPSGDTRFTCEFVNGEYTVMYYPESQPGRAYPWAVPIEMGGGWTPERRCNEISRRLESYREDGLLELTTGVENNYDTICVTTQVDPTACRIVLTVPPGQDPQLTRDLIFDNLLIADDGQQTQGVYTYTNREDNLLNQIGNVLGGIRGGENNTPPQSPENINLRPFLDPADGGTGERLQGGQSAAPTTPQTEKRKPAIFK